jgi:hypothetical protein
VLTVIFALALRPVLAVMPCVVWLLALYVLCERFCSAAAQLTALRRFVRLAFALRPRAALPAMARCARLLARVAAGGLRSRSRGQDERAQAFCCCAGAGDLVHHGRAVRRRSVAVDCTFLTTGKPDRSLNSLATPRIDSHQCSSQLVTRWYFAKGTRAYEFDTNLQRVVSNISLLDLVGQFLFASS